MRYSEIASYIRPEAGRHRNQAITYAMGNSEEGVSEIELELRHADGLGVHERRLYADSWYKYRERFTGATVRGCLRPM